MAQDGRTKWKIANAPYIHKHKGRTRKKDCRIKCTPANGLRLRMLWLANARASQRDIVVWLLLSSSLFVVVWRTLADTPRYAVLYIVQHTLYLCTYVCLNKVEFCDTNFQCNRNFQKKLPCGIASVLLFWWALCHSQCAVLWHTYVYSCLLELITWQIWWFSSLGHGSVLRARHTICVFYNTSLSILYIYLNTQTISVHHQKVERTSCGGTQRRRLNSTHFSYYISFVPKTTIDMIDMIPLRFARTEKNRIEKVVQTNMMTM